MSDKDWPLSPKPGDKGIIRNPDPSTVNDKDIINTVNSSSSS
jgi:hypothetical protein